MSQKWANSNFELVPQKVDFGRYLQTVALMTPYFSRVEQNWISSTLKRPWRDIWFRRRTVCRVKVKFDKSSTDSVELLPHLTETAIPNWFRGCSFVVLNSSVRLGTWVERRLNRTLITTPKGYQLCRRLATYSLGYYGLRNQRHHWNQ